jgi:two-component system, OmpR family, phosphate regulon sensor histidine kinase PhoR
MKRKNLQLILLILALTSLSLLVGIQIKWVLKSARLQEAQFTHAVSMAMNRIVENLAHNQAICSEMNRCLRAGNPASCRMLMQNRIDWADLDTIIKNDLKYYDIQLDYEFDIVEKTVAGKLTEGKNVYLNDNFGSLLNKSGYELIIRFPGKNEFIKAQIGSIFLSSIALLMLISASFILIYRYYRKERRLTENIMDFLNNMTHEFKTPLTNIGLANSMILNSEVIENNKKLNIYSNVIKSEHQRLKEKVDLLLTAALSEAEQPFQAEVFDALAEITNVADTFDVILNDKNGKIVINSSGQEFRLSGSIEMFQIAIGNIIENAIKYNKINPEIVIDVRSGTGNLTVEISDNGIGLSREYYSQIFDKYFRIPTGDIFNNEGFGLGLYFVRNTIRQMKGKIRVSSRVGKGTTFTIELPIHKQGE